MYITRKTFLKSAGYTLAATLLPYQKLFASDILSSQTSPDLKHPQDCTINLKTDYLYNLSDIQIDNDISYAKTPMVHKDVMYKEEENQGTAQTPCDPNTNSCGLYDIFGENPLRYKVYYPKNTVHDYDKVPLPALILFHAGGFAECPNYELPLMEMLCEQFSRRGFITYTVEYRRGRLLDPEKGDYISVQQQLASYRSQQDARGVIRSIAKRQELDMDPFKIDSKQVFVGGASSGAMMALSVAYYQSSADLTEQGMVDAAFPSPPGSPKISDNNVLGPIHADYYFGEPLRRYWPKIAGVLSLSGGIVIPKSYDNHEADFFAGGGYNANPPMIAFHGALDNTIYLDDNENQDIKLSPPSSNGTDYNSESSCLNGANHYAVEGYTKEQGALIKMGSELNMYNVLKQLDKYTELYYDCNMTHDLGPGVDFGIGTSDPDAVEMYMAQRAAIFFQSVMNGVSTFGATGRSIFRKCENKRVSCSPESAASECTNDPYDYEPCH